MCISPIDVAVCLCICLLHYATAKELIKGLLKTNPTERYNIDDVLRHTWISVSYYNNYYIFQLMHTRTAVFFTI